MTGTEYQRLALMTVNRDLSMSEQLANGALGLCGEASEVADVLGAMLRLMTAAEYITELTASAGKVGDRIKKALYQNAVLDMNKLCEELGDVMWYTSLIADTCGRDLDSIMQGNIDKLRRRYPKGHFDAADSAARADHNDN